jgi:hypothetical protein
MRRTAAVIPALLLLLAPAANADAPGQECGGSYHYVDSLRVAVSAPPATVRAGTVVAIPVRVTRGGLRTGAPARDVVVRVHLEQGGDTTTSAALRTDAAGQVVLDTPVPRRARGALRVVVKAASKVATVPCYGTVVEQGTHTGAWGRAVR